MQEEAKTQKRRDERSTAAVARKRLLLRRRLAAQSAREARTAQKQIELESGTVSRQLRSRTRKQLIAQKPLNNSRELVVL